MAFAKSASLSASIWSALALAAAQASAQETTSAELASDAIPSALEEIVVSATKREESLQRVPVSVNAISGDQLKQSGVVRLQDMQLPSLTVQEGGIGNSVFIRGIGSGINPGFEQSAGTYVDGIYRGRAQQSRAPLFDVERVELLRGPQTTLFGKNSVAGAINVKSAKPTSTPSGYVTGTYDFELEQTDLEGAISGPLGDRVRGRLSGRALSADGFVENLTIGGGEPSRDDLSVRGQLEVDATENLVATLKAEVSEFDKEGRGIEIYNERPATAGPFTGLTYAQILSALGSDPSVLNNTLDYRRSGGPETSNNKSEEYALTLDWQLGGGTLTSITGFSTYAFDELCDCDFTGANVFNVGLDEDFDQLSQEIRFASPQGNTLDYIVGAYYEDTELKYRDSILVDQGSLLVPLINARLPGVGHPDRQYLDAPRVQPGRDRNVRVRSPHLERDGLAAPQFRRARRIRGKGSDPGSDDRRHRRHSAHGAAGRRRAGSSMPRCSTSGPTRSVVSATAGRPCHRSACSTTWPTM